MKRAALSRPSNDTDVQPHPCPPGHRVNGVPSSPVADQAPCQVDQYVGVHTDRVRTRHGVSPNNGAGVRRKN